MIGSCKRTHHTWPIALLLALWLVASQAHAQSSDAGVPDGAVSYLERVSGRPPELPPLVERKDGSYRYSGRGFDATIDRDGNVRMRDRFARARFGVFPYQGLNKEWFISFLEVKFDLFAWLDKKFGNDPFRSERRDFFLGTRELRERLASQSAVARLQQELERIWSQALGLLERKRRTFALWDLASEDAFGQLGRDQVVRFVRESCPEDSARGFSPEELKSFNETRQSKQLFAPYGG
jgi:hypothetical protein